MLIIAELDSSLLKAELNNVLLVINQWITVRNAVLNLFAPNAMIIIILVHLIKIVLHVIRIVKFVSTLQENAIVVYKDIIYLMKEFVSNRNQQRDAYRKKLHKLVEIQLAQSHHYWHILLIMKSL